MYKNILALFIFLFLINNDSYAQTPKDASVELSASVQKSPAKIFIHWVKNDLATQHVIYRKLKTANSWGAAKATLSGTAIEYVDSLVTVGTSYEYQVIRTGPGFKGYGYINSGIEIPAIENRGNLILLIDSTFAEPLSTEINVLENDLEGDGWNVITHFISRYSDVPSVKAVILSEYNKDKSNTKAIFLIGHIPVPYSGNLNPDGHPDHQGAWPADVFYADMNGTWTDNTVNNLSANDARNLNIPGDGKYDQTVIPSDIELQIGRVDFANMPAFTLSEMQLLQNYLHKDHEYRHKKFIPLHRAVIDDNFGFFSGESFAQSGWRNASPLVGPENIIADDYFATLTSNSYLWSYGCGGGTYTSAGGVGSTTNFAVSDLQSVFTMLFGSYFGDWDSANNFLRAPLAQGRTLTNVWAGRPHWVFHHMGMGENIGYDVRLTQNNNALYFSNYGSRFIHIALMGDPTLRNDIIAPVEEVSVVEDGNNAIITWSDSNESVSGYNIYMKNDTINEYVRLNNNLITSTSYTDSCLLFPGNYNYMVRAVALQTTPSG
ncbi:MAG: fibronectin type III domain-containing protein, partial [Saprospiraceae bacterium]|nr:fibronectin type III domain-containing protein [Saprospiraceae bacterium]